MSTQVSSIWTPPAIPNKYEVIPIHNSDRASFKRCRRYFDWTSPARQNLTLRADIHGVNKDLWFGTGIHWALEQFYTPTDGTSIRRDPVEAWLTWFDVQWRGGTVTEEWLDLVYDLKPRPYETRAGYEGGPARAMWSFGSTPEERQEWNKNNRLWIVRGLQDILPDADEELFDSLRELGIQMMQTYKKYAEKNDAFEVIVTEHGFSIPIWDYENECALKAVDLREHSPNYGKLLEVHQRGRMDAIYRKMNGKVGVIDHKTSARIDDDFFEKLETDEQVTSYLYAAEVEASYYGLPYAGEPMEECIYNVLRKAYPKPPTIVRGGLFSIDRKEESATYEMLKTWMESQDPQVLYDDLPEKHQAYVDYVRNLGDEQFIIRKLVRRNRHQLRNAGYRAYQEAMDMLDPNLRVYPNLSNDFKCFACAFRAPCIATEDGGDWKDLIQSNFARNRDR